MMGTCVAKHISPMMVNKEVNYTGRKKTSVLENSKSKQSLVRKGLASSDLLRVLSKETLPPDG